MISTQICIFIPTQIYININLNFSSNQLKFIFKSTQIYVQINSFFTFKSTQLYV